MWDVFLPTEKYSKAGTCLERASGTGACRRNDRNVINTAIHSLWILQTMIGSLHISSIRHYRLYIMELAGSSLMLSTYVCYCPFFHHSNLEIKPRTWAAPLKGKKRGEHKVNDRIYVKEPALCAPYQYSMEGGQSASVKFSGINYKIISLTAHYLPHNWQRKRLRLVTPVLLCRQLVSVSSSL